MKTYNRLVILLTVAGAFMTVNAQTTFDAVKLSEEELNGTARYVGMGGAMGALGNDVSAISQNPAAIGTYHNSDINMSISFMGAQVCTDPLYTSSHPGIGGIAGNERTFYSHNTRSDLMLAFDNISAVFSGGGFADSYMNFGFSYRKIQNMDRDLDYVDSFYDADGYLVYREFKDHQRNRINAFDFNVSANLSDLVYLGMTCELLTTDTWSEGYFYDYYDAGVHPDFPGGHDFTAVDKMNSADGSGFNMSMGIIVRPVQAVRLGISLKTPTWFRQNLEYSDFLYALNNEEKDGAKYADNVDYSYSSPWTLDLSSGFTFGKTAVGVEYEQNFVKRSSLSVGNTRIDQGAVDMVDYSTLRFGVEQNISLFSLRAGYTSTSSMLGNNASPYLGDTDFNQSRLDFQTDRLGKRQNFTFGFGYCSQPDEEGSQFYVDMAYVHGIRNSVTNIHEYIEDFDVDYKYKTNKILFTMGWNF